MLSGTFGMATGQDHLLNDVIFFFFLILRKIFAAQCRRTFGNEADHCLVVAMCDQKEFNFLTWFSRPDLTSGLC